MIEEEACTWVGMIGMKEKGLRTDFDKKGLYMFTTCPTVGLEKPKIKSKVKKIRIWGRKSGIKSSVSLLYPEIQTTTSYRSLMRCSQTNKKLKPPRERWHVYKSKTHIPPIFQWMKSEDMLGGGGGANGNRNRKPKQAKKEGRRKEIVWNKCQVFSVKSLLKWVDRNWKILTVVLTLHIS